MNDYYAKRKGLLSDKLDLDFEEILECFCDIYSYFDRKGSFDVAKNGIKVKEPLSGDQEQALKLMLKPSPGFFFAEELQSKEIWPIKEFYESYDETTLFTVIEVLYDHIGTYNLESDKCECKELRTEFAELVNKMLCAYGNGYYLEQTNGFIMETPNIAQQKQLQYDGRELPENVLEKLSSASRMYYRFDANMEQKKKAINILADIMEPEREEIKELLNKEYNIPAQKHDKLIFDIVNKFNIRHNNNKQNTEYSKSIWYDWMMQYYTSVIIAFYKLKQYKDLSITKIE